MFTKQTLTCFAGALAVASASYSVANPSTAEVEAAAATVQPLSPTSNVKGLAFNRFVNIWFENQQFKTVAADPNFAKLASEGILLSNYFAVTHPSEPNYASSAGGENFGLDNDNFHQIPANVSTIADMFDTKGISWGEYQQDMPYPGFQGYEWPETGPDDYERKHNPLILYDSISKDPIRRRQIKNFTSFYEDLKDHKLPQHMFITPNMTNDAHDTSATFAGHFLNRFLSPLLKNEYFMKDTLILVTFDESEYYGVPNRVYSVLLGGAVPEELKGTTDDTFYTHYSIIASLSANWRLPSLGRWDCGANLLKMLADKVGYTNWKVDFSNLYLNVSYPGPLSNGDYSHYEPKWPVPLTNGKGHCSGASHILPMVEKLYHGQEATYNYTSPIPYNSRSGTNTGIKAYRTLPNGRVEYFTTQ